ncbi:MAG: hypothetical protein ACKV0T_16145 [Planctomycetales bacterium]
MPTESKSLDAPSPLSPEQQHNHMLTVFSVSAGMVGVCLTGIGLIQVMTMLKDFTTLCDELLVIDALMFLFSCFVSYWAMHHRLQKHYRRLRLVVDTFLMAGILLMFLVCAMIAWSIL